MEGNTTPQEIHADPGLIVAKLDSWLDGLFRLIPNIAVAIAVTVIFVTLGILVGLGIRRMARNRRRADLGAVIGSVVRWAIWIAGGMLALTILTPSIRPGDLIAGLGIGTVAIGFAFKDILQNLLSGILLLIRQPFAVGDQIVVGDYEGTVEHIQTRATLIKTYDGRRVVIPNADVYTDAVTVNTAFPARRSQYDFGITHGSDTKLAMKVAVDAVVGIERVMADPPPVALSVDLGDFSKVVRLRWWTKSTQADVVHVASDVMLAVEDAFRENGIEIPFPTRTLYLHDRTGTETGGDRGDRSTALPRSETATGGDA
ncbi:mechanosensitive ion channel family protein [uncultured Jannaschia sp.]|uniref:mechanosensitive ion channel family protein n=1 Tax=uncultured Jannaschia sp. TaxID=293347 RepID=UPI002628BED3|nr:mechanosensitive ion channel family protein [uncultured Jannaschia sp.]